MKREVLIIFTLLFLVPFASAGLQIVGDSVFRVNQTIGTTELIVFTLKNVETFSFYNISFENNDIIEMTEISELTSGVSINITATISANEDFSDNIRIVGIYEQNLGVSNETYVVEIDYDLGIDLCDFSIIKGDNIVWKNLAGRTVKLINADTNVDIVELEVDGQYPQTFSESLVLNYVVSWLGFIFDSCRLTVLSDIGPITNPEFDAILFLEVDVDYEPTLLETTFLETNYTMDVFTTEEGMFLIKNAGTKIAKNVYLSGDWFEFTQNNFDIQVGYSKTVSYKIKPITEATNDTDKTYEKNLLITGNFPPIQQTFDIFINYADIDSGYTTGDSLIDIIEKFCEENPDASFCGNEPTVIYKGGNESNMTNEQFRLIIEFWFSEFEDIDTFIEWSKENYFIMSENINQTNQSAYQTQQDVEQIKKEGSNATNMIFFIIISISGITILGGGGYLAWHFKKEKILEEFRRW